MAKNIDRGFVSEYYSETLDKVQCFVWVAAKIEAEPAKSIVAICKEMQSYFGWTEDIMPYMTIHQYYYRVLGKFKKTKSENNGSIRP